MNRMAFLVCILCLACHCMAGGIFGTSPSHIAVDEMQSMYYFQGGIHEIVGSGFPKGAQLTLFQYPDKTWDMETKASMSTDTFIRFKSPDIHMGIGPVLMYFTVDGKQSNRVQMATIVPVPSNQFNISFAFMFVGCVFGCGMGFTFARSFPLGRTCDTCREEEQKSYDDTIKAQRHNELEEWYETRKLCVTSSQADDELVTISKRELDRLQEK
jgi:hypothetical protein